ncbi:MAG: transglutaminase-like domain-containing protein [Romboutsia sp.]|uniref:transglutaminase-like domain-containing protein n=1 Tax=Romboutsia sp. TaxID=1965302 RepID=UPI003F3E6788
MEAMEKQSLFSSKYREEIEYKFEDIMKDLGKIKNNIEKKLSNCSKEEEIAIKYLYTTMPLSDIADYSFDVFYDYAKHAIYLWKEPEYSQDIDEDIFLNYVMYHRVNNEDILPCRSFFYNEIKELIKDKSIEDAIKELNYWCASKVTYQATDDRTISPIGAYNSAFGRCGEESTFAVTIFRSAGIPARQVYAPRWSHCDDNHAWVEVYFNNKWHFLGACEPDELLNRGWFTQASSRAMMIHSKWFDNKKPNEKTSGKSGIATVVNNLELYANTTDIKICIKDKDGNKLSNVNVDFEVINYSEYFPITSLITDEEGEVKTTLGLGSIHIHVYKDDLFADEIINTQNLENKTVNIILEKKVNYDLWKDMELIAPTDSQIHTIKPSKEIKDLGKAKLKIAVDKRHEKVESFYKEDLANDIIRNCKDKDSLKEILKLSRGNFVEVEKFILAKVAKEEENYKEDILKTLSIKDYRDFKSEVLIEHLKEAIKHSKKYSEEIFVKYILNPRIHIENLTDYRKFINDYFKEEKQVFINNPYKIWEYINENIKHKEECEYKGVLTSPKGCLIVKHANKTSRKILFVAICRSFGIPAKINEIDGNIEVYNEDKFVAVEAKVKKECVLKISSKEDTIWTYFLNWSIAKLNNGVYESLNLMDISFNEGISLNVEAGEYRIITSNRLPNGNIFAKKLCFKIYYNEEQEINLKLRGAKLSDMLEDIKLPEFTLLNKENKNISAREIIKNRKHIFIWLEESKEPTEHILNEIYERKNEFKELQDQMTFIVKNKESLNDPTLFRNIKEFENINIYYDDFKENINTVARAMFEEPEKYPLVVATNKDLHGIYSTTGYNVGTADMLLRILNA